MYGTWDKSIGNYLAVSINWEVFSVGVLVIRALLLGPLPHDTTAASSSCSLLIASVACYSGQPSCIMELGPHKQMISHSGSKAQYKGDTRNHIL